MEKQEEEELNFSEPLAEQQTLAAPIKKNRSLLLCEHCEFKTKIRSAYIEHIQAQHNIQDCTRIYACMFCEQRFPWRRRLLCHMQHKHREHHACEECDASFATASQLQMHCQRKHAQKEMHKCPHPSCGRQFNRAFAMRRHYNNLHVHEKRYFCTECNKHFSLLETWRYHVEVVHQHATQHCPQCGLSFRFQHKLAEHLSSNVCAGLLLDCPQCERSFALKKSLQRHIKLSHEKVK